jgi:hypothetical protein
MPTLSFQEEIRHEHMWFTTATSAAGNPGIKSPAKTHMMNRSTVFRLPLKLMAVLLAASAVLCSTVIAAGTLAVDWSTDKEPVSYLPGETMTFQVQLVLDGRPMAGKTLRWVREGDDRKTATGEAKTSESEPSLPSRVEIILLCAK